MEAKIQGKSGVKARVRRFEEYQQYCRIRGYHLHQPTYQSIAGFICSWVIRNHGSCASITQVISHLRVHSRQSPLLGWLTESDEALLSDLVKALLDLDTRGVRRVYALRFSTLAKAIALMDLSDAVQLMVATMLSLAQNLLLRTGEITSGIKARDIQWTSEDGSSVRLHLCRTKTVRSGGGVSLDATAFNHAASGVRLLRRWWLLRGLDHTPEALVFPAVRDGSFVAGPNAPAASGDFFRRVLKAGVFTVGEDPHHYSGHSCRAGGATDLFAAGTPYYVVKRAGRWKSDVAVLYFRSEFEVAAAVARGFNRICSKAKVPRINLGSVVTGCDA